MYARVSRFTNVDADAIESNITEFRNRAASGPPEGVPSTGVKLLVEKANGTVIVIGFFATEEDLKTGDAALRDFTPPGGSMGTPEVTLCEVAFEAEAP